MNTLYPLKFKPIFKDKIWGGTRIRSELGHDFAPLANCGEMWVLSGVEEEESIVFNGFLEGNTINELVEVYMGDLVGDAVFEKYGEVFPILVKFIDTNSYLSIQVHPDDELALKRYDAPLGKTEMWHVLHAEPGSEIIDGFSKTVSKEHYLKHLNEGTLKDILNIEKPVAGDTFFIPAGRVHAIGSGLLLAEIQQTSDITYRIYDWDRLDVSGLPRELHTELALDAINFEGTQDAKISMQPDKERPVTLVNCPQFTTRYRSCSGKISLDYHDLDSFVILLCIEGEFELDTSGTKVQVKKGEVVLLPAEIRHCEMSAEENTSILETWCG
jgi:mannose-6-phosphate isomerase